MIGEHAEVFESPCFVQIVHGFRRNQRAGDLAGDQGACTVGTSRLVEMDERDVFVRIEPQLS